MIASRTEVMHVARDRMQAEGQSKHTDSHVSRCRRPITKALIKIVNQKVPNNLHGRTYSKLIAEVLVGKALQGNVQAAKAITDLIEGRVPRATQAKPAGPRQIRIISAIPRPVFRAPQVQEDTSSS